MVVLASSIAMLYIHPWTWSLLMAILTLHLTFSALDFLRKGNFKLDKHLLTVLAGNIFADIVKTLTYPSYGGLASSTAVLGYSRAFGLEPLLDLPRNLHRLTVSYVDGLFFNLLHTALALVGVLSLSKKGDSLSRLFVIWLAVVSLIFPFSNVGLQSHLLFATPFPILIAEGLWVLSRLLARFDSKLPKLFIIFFIVSSLTYTVRALCNLI
jgi:Na+-transporting NADH:ubiquinone oxidoreductase subunit NqrB